MGTEILYYIPNVIGYARIGLAIMAFLLWDYPFYFVMFYTTSVSLDCVDGYTARIFKQESRFGAWFDVVIDLFSRGCLWCGLSKWGYVVIMLEWMTFLSTHSKGPNWKETSKKFPDIVQKVMANGFFSRFGALAIAGLHVLPIWLYAMQTEYLYDLGIPCVLQYLVVAVLIAGRLVSLRVEIFYNYKYIEFLLDEESETNGEIKKNE